MSEWRQNPLGLERPSLVSSPRFNAIHTRSVLESNGNALNAFEDFVALSFESSHVGNTQMKQLF